MAKKKSASREKVPDSVPRVHEPGPGLTEETARLLDLSLVEMQQGKPLPDDSGASLLTGPPTNRRS